jgi:tetratricopeptide (TPR) repeat protein
VITHLRLFRRHPALAWRGRVHEQLRPCLSTLGYELIHSDVQIDHLGYRDATLKQRKLLRDTRLLRLDYAVDPENPSTLLHLGITYARSGNSALARKYLLQMLAAEQPSCDYLRHAFSTLAEMSLCEGKCHESLDIATRALTLFKHNQHFLYLQAESLYELDQYAAARSVLMQIINGPDAPQFRGGAPHEIKNKLAPRCLGEVLRIERHLAAAESVLQAVVHHFPDDAMSWYVLGRVYIDTADWPALDRIRERLQACSQGETLSLLLLAGWQLKRGKLELADSVVDELIAKAPQLTIARLMRAELLCRRNAPVAARLRAYRDVLRVQPGNAMAAEMIEQLENSLRKPAGEAGWSSSITVAPTAPSGVIYT